MVQLVALLVRAETVPGSNPVGGVGRLAFFFASRFVFFVFPPVFAAIFEGQRELNLIQKIFYSLSKSSRIDFNTENYVFRLFFFVFFPHKF